MMASPFIRMVGRLLPLLALSACSATDALNALTSASDYAMVSGVPYGEGHRARLDIYQPRKTSCPESTPVVVFFYGGTWNTGSRQQYAFVAASLARHGILTVIPDYRLYPEVVYPDFLVDSAQAVTWTLRNIERFGGDPARVFLMGHSAGAYNAAMLALDRRWLKHAGVSPTSLRGWIGLAGPYDFLPIENPQAQPVFHHPNYPVASQPIDHASPQSPPAFVGVDAGDRLVNPRRNSMQIAERLMSDGVAVDYREYTRLSHTLLIGAFAGPLRWLSPVSDDVADFVMANSACNRDGAQR